MTVDIWPGSRLSLDGDAVTKALGTGAPDPFVLAFLLLISLALVLLYSRLVAAISGSSSFFRGAYPTSETLGNKYLCDSITMMYILVVPFYAVALRMAGLGNSFLLVFGVLCGLLLLRKAVYALFAWLSGRQAAVRSIERVGYGIFLMVALASFLPVPVLMMLPSRIFATFRIYLSIVALIGYLFYAVRSLQLISATGFSSFFWVLYLCTLEILPVCVAVNYLMNGN